jgi:hypothetical protein
LQIGLHYPASGFDEISAERIQVRRPPQVYIVVEKQNEARKNQVSILHREEFSWGCLIQPLSP